MSATVIPFTGKTLRPMDVALGADNVRSARADFAMATALLTKAQELRQKASRGDIRPPERSDLMEALVVLGVHPKPPQPS